MTEKEAFLLNGPRNPVRAKQTEKAMSPTQAADLSLKLEEKYPHPKTTGSQYCEKTSRYGEKCKDQEVRPNWPGETTEKMAGNLLWDSRIGHGD